MDTPGQDQPQMTKEQLQMKKQQQEMEQLNQ